MKGGRSEKARQGVGGGSLLLDVTQTLSAVGAALFELLLSVFIVLATSKV